MYRYSIAFVFKVCYSEEFYFNFFDPMTVFTTRRSEFTRSLSHTNPLPTSPLPRSATSLKRHTSNQPWRVTAQMVNRARKYLLQNPCFREKGAGTVTQRHGCICCIRSTRASSRQHPQVRIYRALLAELFQLITCERSVVCARHLAHVKRSFVYVKGRLFYMSELLVYMRRHLMQPYLLHAETPLVYVNVIAYKTVRLHTTLASLSPLPLQLILKGLDLTHKLVANLLYMKQIRARLIVFGARHPIRGLR